jgi:uracil-DNA glycosylase
MAFASPADLSPIPKAEAPRDCPLCPRLVRLRNELRIDHEDWWNAPVPAFGDADAWLAIVGLAPGRKGANRTGQPFTVDFSGEFFFAALLKLGLAEGRYADEVGTLRMNGAIVLNAVKCLPPANKPTPEEVATCSHYLEAALANLPNLRVVVALGQIAHVAAAKALHLWPKSKFSHGAEAISEEGRVLLSTYHCSRQNTNTGKLTRQMFEKIFERAVALKCPR